MSSDVFAVIVKTSQDGLSGYQALIQEDRLEQILRELPEVQTTVGDPAGGGAGSGHQRRLRALFAHVQLAYQRDGASLEEPYAKALAFTGKVVLLVGITLAAGVVSWAWSPIKLQADIGILLPFMFLWNMVGALILIPALSHFLLPTHKVEQALARRPTPPAGKGQGTDGLGGDGLEIRGHCGK